MSLSQFAVNLPSFASTGGFFQDQTSASDAELASIHIMMHAAIIHLHRDLMELVPASYQRCLVAANNMTAVVRELGDGDYDYLEPIVSVSDRPGVGSPQRRRLTVP